MVEVGGMDREGPNWRLRRGPLGAGDGGGARILDFGGETTTLEVK